MLNILNIGFEHALRISVDDHKIWIVADDGGFVEPQQVDVGGLLNRGISG
jgi:predicted Rdx family selenoprotein